MSALDRSGLEKLLHRSDLRRLLEVLNRDGEEARIVGGAVRNALLGRPVTEVDAWLVDPDGAVVRAGLVRQFAARHGLAQLDPHLAYLTGPTPPSGMRAFRVLEEGPFGEKALRQTLRRRGVGRVEILVRGLDVEPDRLRPRLKLAGPEAATVVLARVGRGARAYVCETP